MNIFEIIENAKVNTSQFNDFDNAKAVSSEVWETKSGICLTLEGEVDINLEYDKSYNLLSVRLNIYHPARDVIDSLIYSLPNILEVFSDESEMVLIYKDRYMIFLNLYEKTISRLMVLLDPDQRNINLVKSSLKQQNILEVMDLLEKMNGI